MKKISSYIFFIFLFPLISLAQTSAGIPSGGIWFSKEPFFAGEQITISTIVFNSTKSEVTGNLELMDKDIVIEKKEITLSASDNKIVNFPITVSEGKHTFSVRIAGGNLSSGDGAIVVSKTDKTIPYYSSKTDEVVKDVLKDTDSDGIADNFDTDIDGDSLTNDQEKKLGTNPLLADTDGDSILDSVDKRPLKFDTLPSTTTSITEQDTKNVANNIEKVVPKSVVAPVVAFTTPVIGKIESFRVGQADGNNDRINGTIDDIIDKVGTARVLGAATQATGTATTSKTITGKPSGWDVFKSGVTNKDDFVKSPFGYIKLLGFLIFQFVISNTWVFYILAIAIIIKLLVWIKKLIFNRGE